MKEFRQHQPSRNQYDNVEKEAMYTWLYMEGDDEYYIQEIGDEIQLLEDTREHREKDSKLIVILTTN